MTLGELNQFAGFNVVNSFGDVNRVIGDALEVMANKEKIGALDDDRRIFLHRLMDFRSISMEELIN